MGRFLELLVRVEVDDGTFENLMYRLQGQSATTEDIQSPESMVEHWVRSYYAWSSMFRRSHIYIVPSM
jgi:hypothetical protein